MNPEMRKFSQNLRKNATQEENKLWYDFLRQYPVPFRRQVPFSKYVLDFYCAQAKLAIELDGSQHYQEAGPEKDAERTEYLERTYGIRVIRFTNLEIKTNFEGVCTAVDGEIKRRAPSSAPCGGTFPPVGGRQEQENHMKQVTIYTDGACSGNPGPGGWGAVFPQKV